MHINPIETALTRDGLTVFGSTCLEQATTLKTELLTLSADPQAALTWENTFQKLDQIMASLTSVGCLASLMSVVHPDKDLRTSAETWDPHITNFVTDLFVHASLAALFRRAAQEMTHLTDNRRLFVEDTLRDFRRNGLNLATEKQMRLKHINEELTKLGQEFERNLATMTGGIEVDPKDLEGLPEPYIAGHPVKDNGKIEITTNTSDRIVFSKYSKNRVAARELYFVSMNRCKDENIPLLDKLLTLRFEKAQLLGYATWADYVTEPRMAKNAKTVASFLEELRRDIQPGIAKDLAIIQEFSPSPISVADILYFEELACKKKFALDSQRLSECFEFNATLNGFMKIASKIFNITFQKVDAVTWHADVRSFDILDAHNSALIGRIYLDLHPRPDKYKHAAEFPVRLTHLLPDGTRVTPIATLVCNFTKPDEHASLLTHGEVTTLFHEFGHALHEILSQAELVSQAGTRVAWDFVETPSQLLEEFAWSKEALDLFATHYKTGEPLPQELYDAMIRARGFGAALHTAQQLYYAALDQAFHTREPKKDTTALVEQLFKDYLPFEPVPDTHFQATFGHLVNYDAGYYSYQWALAIARDLLTRFEKEGMFNPTVANDYRKMILGPGGSQDENEMVGKFLGRKTNLDAYKKFLGVT